MSGSTEEVGRGVKRRRRRREKGGRMAKEREGGRTGNTSLQHTNLQWLTTERS